MVMVLLLTTTASACVVGRACACTSDSTCNSTTPTSTSTTPTTAILFSVGGRCEASNHTASVSSSVCRLSSGFLCGDIDANDTLNFVTTSFQCAHSPSTGVSTCQCGASAGGDALSSCSVLDDNAQSITCSSNVLTATAACPVYACPAAEPTTTSRTTRTNPPPTNAPCPDVDDCHECQIRDDCVWCGASLCVDNALCTDPDAESRRCVENFWNDSTTAIVAAVVVAGVLVLILCAVAACTTQRDREPVKDPFVLEMRTVSEHDRIARVKKDLLVAEEEAKAKTSAELAKMSAADDSDAEVSALTESD
jgi:hypothetical protein